MGLIGISGCSQSIFIDGKDNNLAMIKVGLAEVYVRPEGADESLA
jgi:hypothetical protein